MKNRRKFKDRCSENRKYVNSNGRYSSLTQALYRPFLFGLEREITYQNPNNPHRQQDEPAADHPARVPKGIRALH